MHGEVFILESSYEVLLATILNGLGIKWIRPGFIRYVDDYGKSRRYHPDFYLPDHNLYLDPKNDYLAAIDKAKIEKVSIQSKQRILILTVDQLNQELVASIIS
jgi:hypothetical protein